MNDTIYRQFKYIIIGDSNVGKTSIMNRFVNNKFSESTMSTIGFDYEAKKLDVFNIKGQKMKIGLRIWDTAGQERYRSVIKSYYRDAKCILLAFSVTDRNTFNNLAFWLEDINRTVCVGSNACPLVYLVGNKIDMTEKREVTYSEAQLFAHDHGMEYVETSAKMDNGINYLFAKSINNLVVNYDGDTELQEADIKPNTCGSC